MRNDGRLEWVPNAALDPVVVPLYRHAQPASVVPVVPDEILCKFYEVANWPDLVRELVKHVEQLQDSAKRNVKPWEDTFPETLLPAYIDRIKQADDACRAAMLQAGNSPVIPDGLIAAVNRLLDSDGSRGCYSAIQCGDAHDEIERLLAAAPQPQNEQQNIPEIIPGWIPVSEQPPRIGARVLISDIERSGVYEALRFDGNRFNHFGCEIIANYWMPLPAAPKQENI